MAKESKLQSMILNDLRSLGKYCECFKIKKTSDSGIPDIFFTTKLTGAILLELKQPTGTLKRLQKIKIDRLNRCGTKAFVCYSWYEWTQIRSHLHMERSTIILADNIQQNLVL